MTSTSPLHFVAEFIMSLQTLCVEFEHVTFVFRHADVYHQLGHESGEKHGPSVSGWGALHQAGGVETAATGEPRGRAQAGAVTTRHQFVRCVVIHSHTQTHVHTHTHSEASHVIMIFYIWGFCNIPNATAFIFYLKLLSIFSKTE